MGKINVFDSVNKRWLKATSIFISPEDGEIYRITAMELDHTDSLTQGWWTFET